MVNFPEALMQQITFEINISDTIEQVHIIGLYRICIYTTYMKDLRPNVYTLFYPLMYTKIKCMTA